jgi:hypothetical protein
MDHTNDAEMVCSFRYEAKTILINISCLLKLEPNYDIFENSSPQRPITSHGEPLPNDTVDEVLHSNNVVNFSRKRELRDQGGPYSKKAEHGYKRQRHTKWPAQAGAQDTPRAKDRITSPSRVSKFHEGSMHDRPSAKPPSLFTRHFNKHVSASVDELMGQYYQDNDKPLPPYPTSRAARDRTTRSPQRKRESREMQEDHVNQIAASMYSIDGSEAQAGSFFKFGKSMASAFNPVNVWSKFTTGWRSAKEELVEEAEDAHKREMLERQKKAEQAYAELKQAGKLGSQGSHMMNGAPVFTPGYTQPAKNENQRDSGISMDDDSRASGDISNG